jgi:hypothetical protein
MYLLFLVACFKYLSTDVEQYIIYFAHNVQQQKNCGSIPQEGGGVAARFFLFNRVHAGYWPQPITSDKATDSENVELIPLISYGIYTAAGTAPAH